MEEVKYKRVRAPCQGLASATTGKNDRHLGERGRSDVFRVVDRWLGKKGEGGAVIRESERALSVNRVTGNCARIIVVNRGNELFANAEGLVFWEMNSLA